MENYSVFQIEEEHRQSLTNNYLYVIYKQANEYPGQPEILPEKVSKYRIDYLYNNTDEEIQTRLDCWKEIYNREYNPRIVEACNNIFEKRVDKGEDQKPLYFYNEELESSMKEALKEELEAAKNEYLKKELEAAINQEL